MLTILIKLKYYFFSKLINIKVIFDFTNDFMLTIEHNKIDGYLPMLCKNFIFTRKCSPWSNDLNVCFDALSSIRLRFAPGNQ